MAQKFDYLKSEVELRKILDELYNISKLATLEGKRPSIRGLVEIMTSEITIVTAIHNIKPNKGSKTPGIDSKTIKTEYLGKISLIMAILITIFGATVPISMSLKMNILGLTERLEIYTIQTFMIILSYNYTFIKK